MEIYIPVIIFCVLIVSAALGIVFLIIVLDPDRKKCTLEVEAEITGFETVEGAPVMEPTALNHDYHGRYKYTYNGIEYEDVGDGIIPDMYKIGQKIKIYINPNNPAQSSTHKQFERMVNRNVMILIIVFVSAFFFLFLFPMILKGN